MSQRVNRAASRSHRLVIRRLNLRIQFGSILATNHPALRRPFTAAASHTSRENLLPFVIIQSNRHRTHILRLRCLFPKVKYKRDIHFFCCLIITLEKPKRSSVTNVILKCNKKFRFSPSFATPSSTPHSSQFSAFIGICCVSAHFYSWTRGGHIRHREMQWWSRIAEGGEKCVIFRRRFLGAFG